MSFGYTRFYSPSSRLALLEKSNNIILDRNQCKSYKMEVIIVTKE
jgi:hypothetical protein